MKQTIRVSATNYSDIVDKIEFYEECLDGFSLAMNLVGLEKGSMVLKLRVAQYSYFQYYFNRADGNWNKIWEQDIL